MPVNIGFHHGSPDIGSMKLTPAEIACRRDTVFAIFSSQGMVYLICYEILRVGAVCEKSQYRWRCEFVYARAL
jgi:hypothetical protein